MSTKTGGLIKISGTIVDEATGRPIEYATISLKGLGDITQLLGTLADEKGHFELEIQQQGAYVLKISFLGYRTLFDTLNLVGGVPHKKLGTFKLSAAAHALQDVTVKGEKEVFENSIDKKVFNVEKDALVVGGSGTDVLRQIPIINFDQENNIQLRGTTNVTVWINGRPSGLTGTSKQAVLDNIPASSIERVEIITNPSARYDAEGMGGIINIILKKNRTDGINGNFMVNAGTRDAYNRSNTKYNTLNKTNEAFSINVKTGKWNISSNFGYRYNHAWHTINNLRLNKFSNPDLNYHLNQYTTADTLVRQNFNAGLNLEYSLNDKNTIGTGTFVSYNTGLEKELIHTDWLDNRSVLYQQRKRDIISDQMSYSFDQNIFYRKTFSKAGQEFNSSIAYTQGFSDYMTHFKQFDVFVPETLENKYVARSSLNGLGENRNAVLQVDYIHPYSELTKLETGAKATLRNFDNKLIADTIDRSGTTINDAGRSNSFLFSEYVYAGYGLINQNLKFVAVQLGLRYEHTFISGTLNSYLDPRTNQIVPTSTSRNDYYTFFPSFYVSKKTSGDQEVRLGYSYRINRPGPEQLNPFPTWNNPLDLRFGNPFLNPEYTHSAEGTYSRNWKAHNLTATLYYRRTENSIQRFRTITPEGVAIMEFKNASYTENMGGEFIVRNQWFPIWSTTATVNVFQSFIKGLEISNQMPSANFRLQSQLRVWKNLDIQINGNYMLPVAVLQGTFQGFNGVDIGMRKELFRNKASLSVNLSDIFDTRYMTVQFNNASQFSGSMFRQRESRVLTVAFTYKFGKENLSTKNRRRSESGPQQGGGGMDAGF